MGWIPDPAAAKAEPALGYDLGRGQVAGTAGLLDHIFLRTHGFNL